MVFLGQNWPRDDYLCVSDLSSCFVFKIVEATINKTKCFVHLDHLPKFADATYTSCGC